MSLEEKGFRRTLRLQGRNLVTVPDSGPGESFRGTVNRIGAYVMNTSLSDDPRGKRFLEIHKDVTATLIRRTKIQDKDSGEFFKITAIGLDCPEYSRRYELIQVTSKDT